MHDVEISRKRQIGSPVIEFLNAKDAYFKFLRNANASPKFTFALMHALTIHLSGKSPKYLHKPQKLKIFKMIQINVLFFLILPKP